MPGRVPIEYLNHDVLILDQTTATPNLIGIYCVWNKCVGVTFEIMLFVADRIIVLSFFLSSDYVTFWMNQKVLQLIAFSNSAKPTNLRALD